MEASHTAARKAQHGVTLIEMCVVCTVAATLVGTALPSYKATIERRMLEGHAAELAGDVQYLRSQAVASNRTLRISFRSDTSGSCYVIHSGVAGSCDCSADGPAQCTAEAESFKSVALPATGPVRLQSNVGSMVFDPVHGTSTPAGTLRLIDRQGRAVHHIVNIMGRLRSCSPGAAVPGYKAC